MALAAALDDFRLLVGSIAEATDRMKAKGISLSEAAIAAALAASREGG